MENTFHFNYADRRPRLHTVADYRIWLGLVLAQFGKVANDVRFIFCSDEFLLQINRRFLQHDYYTDIITFNLGDEMEAPIFAEIYISWDRVKDNAREVGVRPIAELRRVMAHGLLHLCGFGDKTKREKAEMAHQEDLCLRLWDNLHQA